MIEFFGRPFSSNGLNEDWIKIGTDDSATYLNLNSLESTNAHGYRKANGHSDPFKASSTHYIPLVKSTSGQHSILTRGDIDALAPLILTSLPDKATRLVAGRDRFSFDGYGGIFKYNPDESLLAYGNYVSNEIYILNSEDSTEVAHFETNLPIRFFTWSAEDKKTLLLIVGENPHLILIRYNLTTKSEETINELKRNEFIKNAIFQYSPDLKKIIIAVSNEKTSTLFVVNERDGNGEFMDFPLEISQVTLNPNGHLLAAVNSFSVFVHQVDHLANWGETPRTRPQISHVIYSVFSRNSQLAVIRWDGQLELFEIQ